MRTFFEKPIRKGTTEEFFPDKMSIDEFYEDVLHGAKSFVANMKNLKLEDRYAEEWMETFAVWSEIEQEP